MVQPRRNQTHRRIPGIIELPDGTAHGTGTEVGDQLQVQGYSV